MDKPSHELVLVHHRGRWFWRVSNADGKVVEDAAAGYERPERAAAQGLEALKWRVENDPPKR